MTWPLCSKKAREGLFFFAAETTTLPPHRESAKQKAVLPPPAAKMYFDVSILVLIAWLQVKLVHLNDPKPSAASDLLGLVPSSQCEENFPPFYRNLAGVPDLPLLRDSDKKAIWDTLNQLPWSPFSNLPCSGHGTCVVSNTTQRHLCICDAGWNGANDFFDFRVESHRGTHLALDCTNSVFANQFWYAFHFWLYFRNLLLLLAHQFKQIRKVLARGHPFWRAFGFRVLLLDCFDMLVVARVCYLKVYYNAEHCVGTSMETTILFSTSLLLFMVSNVWLGMEELRQIQDLFRGTNVWESYLGNSRKALMFQGFASLLNWCMLWMDKQSGPFSNGQLVLVAVRSLAGVGWQMHMIAGKKILADSFENASHMAEELLLGGSKQKHAMASVLANFQAQAQNQQGTLWLYSTLGFLCALPCFAPYSSYFYGVISILRCVADPVKLLGTMKKRNVTNVPPPAKQQQRKEVSTESDSYQPGLALFTKDKTTTASLEREHEEETTIANHHSSE